MRLSYSEWLHLREVSPDYWRTVLCLPALPGLAYLVLPPSLARRAADLAGLGAVLSLVLAGVSQSDLTDLGLASALGLSRVLMSR